MPQMTIMWGGGTGRWSGEGEIIINFLFTAPKGAAHETRQNPIRLARLIVATHLYALGSDKWIPTMGPG